MEWYNSLQAKFIWSLIKIVSRNRTLKLLFMCWNILSSHRIIHCQCHHRNCSIVVEIPPRNSHVFHRGSMRFNEQIICSSVVNLFHTNTRRFAPCSSSYQSTLNGETRAAGTRVNIVNHKRTKRESETKEKKIQVKWQTEMWYVGDMFTVANSNEIVQKEISRRLICFV